MISSLVLQVESPEDVSVVVSVLKDIDQVEVGQTCRDRIPIVIEAENPRDLERLTDTIARLEKVNRFDVTYVSFEGR